MAIFKASHHPAMANESPAVTPTFCHTARPSSSSSVLSGTSAVPSLTSSSDSNSIASLEPLVPVGGFFYTPSMHQLDTSGYPTRALYYLHKRMLEVVLHPGVDHNQPWCLQTRPGTPVPSSPLGDDDEGIVAPENSLEEEEVLKVLGEMKQVRSMEEDPILHNLCAMLVSTQYVTPPIPPVGATPCDTPPEFEAPMLPAHEEYTCCIAKMLVSSDVAELDDWVVQECQVEWECGGVLTSGGCPCGKNESKKTLLEEMEVCGSKTPRETRQARRRARNSLRGVAREVIVEAF